MLHDFLATHRDTLLEKSVAMSALQGLHSDPQTDSYGRISIFLDQLVDILRLEKSVAAAPALPDETGDPPRLVPTAAVARSAANHGRELRSLGFTIEEVVRNYGGICQAITTLAIDLNTGIEVAEFRILNRCLDEAIAQAVVAYTNPELETGAPVQPGFLKNSARLDGLAAMFHHVETDLPPIAVPI